MCAFEESLPPRRADISPRGQAESPQRVSQWAFTLTCLAATTLLLGGCNPQGPSNPAELQESIAPDVPEETATLSDDPASVQALEEAGAILTLNAAGLVTAVDFRAVEGQESALVHLSGLAALEQLYLVGPGFTSAGLAPVAKVETLRLLSLEKTLTDDEGLKLISGMTSLVALRLRQTDVSDVGIVHLADLDNLRNSTSASRISLTKGSRP